MAINAQGHYVPNRLLVIEVLALEGYTTLEDWMADNVLSDEAPACCSEGCIVEPDGICPHGFPSLPLAAKII